MSKDPSLEVAILMSTTNENEEVPTSKKKTKAKKEKKPSFIVMEDKKDIFLSRIQINDNDIKHTMVCYNSEVVNERSIFSDLLTGPALERAEASSRYSIMSLIEDGKSNNWIKHIGGTKEFNSFTSTLLEYASKFEELFNTVTQSDKIKFSLLPYFVKEGKLLAVNIGEDRWAGLRVTDAKISMGWSGPQFKIEGRIIIYDGKGFKEAPISNTIGYFEGEKTFPSIGIRIPEQDTELKNLLIERGKKYERIHNNGPSYMVNKGSIVRRSYWYDHNFPATGRVMIDRIGMVNIDPDYNMYFGYDRYRDDDENNKPISIDFTDDQYFVCSPFCYGFSFVAKQWGEIDINQLSDIKFRSESYSKLVLNKETKEILFSLTETSEQGKDLIDGKGGGSIFLLHGEPGVGK